MTTSTNISKDFFHPDHLGSSTLITDNFGEPYQFFLNLPFGETMAEQRRNGSFNNPYKFNGKELDEETGLYYYGARYYNPRTSVFISVDPLTEQTMTPYQYTYQNPIKYVDPDGKAPYDHIFIWKNGKLTMYDNKNGSSLIYINGVLMSDLDLDVKQNRILIANVAAYYANSIGHKTNVYGGEGKMIFGLSPIEEERESSSMNPAFIYGNDIYINSLDFNLNCEINDYYDFISIIEHEIIHKESNHGFNVINSLDHAEVYMKQIGSKNFDKTTSRFKKSMVNSFVNQLNEANKEFGIGKKTSRNDEFSK